MDVKIKLVDPSLPVPEYKTAGSVAFDLYARREVIVAPNVPTIVPTNIVIQIPEGHFLLLALRSSTPKKKGLMIANGIGVIDEDYCGDDDEVGLLVLNIRKSDVVVAKGERIGQAILMPYTRIDRFKIVKQMGNQSRGGFGSTG